MTEPLTRHDVEREVESVLAEMAWPVDEQRVAAALLANRDRNGGYAPRLERVEEKGVVEAHA